MKRKLFATIGILIIFLNLFLSFQITKESVNNVMFDKTGMEIIENSDRLDYSRQELVDNIIAFAAKENIEIAQYRYMGPRKIDIYSTNPSEYKGILTLSNFLYGKELEVHDYNEVIETGGFNLYYLNKGDKDTLSKIRKEFEKYGDLSIAERELEDSSFLRYFIYFINSKIISVFYLINIIILVMIFLYNLSTKKLSEIYDLWGYTKWQIFIEIHLEVFKTSLICSLSYNLSLFIFGFLLKIKEYLNYYFIISLVTNLLLFIFMFLASYIIFNLSFIKINMKSFRKRYKHTKYSAYLLKILSIFLLVVLLGNFFSINNEIDTQLKNVEQWENTKNLYALQRNALSSQVDLAKDDENNLKISKVYQQLVNFGNTFIIDSRNFMRIPNLDNDNDNDYKFSYIEDLRDIGDVFSHYGNGILVDHNYLQRKPIYSHNDGKNVKNKIIFDDKVLNLLVPEKYKENENIIKENYLDWFYFQKVEVANMYKKEKGEKPSDGKIEDLNINLIYIKSDNKYFTYNIDTGDQYDNKILDPIMYLYTGNIDNSVLASTVGSSLLFESDNYKEASKKIGEVTEKNKAPFLNSFTSVYEQKGQEIDRLKERKNSFVINMLTTFIIVSIVTIYIIYMYYESNMVQIAVQSLFGYGFFNLNRDIFITNLIIYLGISLVSIFILKIAFKLNIGVILFIILLDIVASLTIYKSLLEDGELDFVKEIL